MIYYISVSQPIELLSIGIQCSDGRSYYAECSEFPDADHSDPEAVAAIAALRRSNGDSSALKTGQEIVDEVAAFMSGDTSPQFVVQSRFGSPDVLYFLIPQSFDQSLHSNPGYAATYNSAAEPAVQRDDNVCQWLSDSHPIATTALSAQATAIAAVEAQHAIDVP